MSFDAGSSLIPAAEKTAEAVDAAYDEEEEEEIVKDANELDTATAAAVVRDLKRAGFKLRQTYGKASYKQSNIESSVKYIKKILKASFLPGMAGMTVTSFTRVVQLSVSTLSLHTVILLPYDAVKPGELTVLSPQALRGPDHAQYVALARARHFTGQAAIIAQQQQSFAKKWKIFYTARLRRTHSMAQNELEGGGFTIGDIVLILDLSSSQGQNPFPQLGIIHAFLAPGQAELHYGSKEGRLRTVNRPLSKLSKLEKPMNRSRQRGCYLIPSSRPTSCKKRKQRNLVMTVKETMKYIKMVEPTKRAARPGQGMPRAMVKLGRARARQEKSSSMVTPARTVGPW